MTAAVVSREVHAARPRCRLCRVPRREPWHGAHSVLWLVAVALFVSGCSSAQIYNAAQGWRRNECYKLGDLDQRERCLKAADRPYEVYRAATGRD